MATDATRYRISRWGCKDPADQEKIRELASEAGLSISKKGIIPQGVDQKKITAFEATLKGKFTLPINIVAD